MSSSLIFFVSNYLNRTSVKVTLQQRDFRLKINISLNVCTFWCTKDTDQFIRMTPLTLLIFAVGCAVCGRPQPGQW